MGGNIEGRIPNPNSYRGEKGGKKVSICFCESSPVVTCPPTPMVVVGVREFLRIWGYLPQKCTKTWALVPSNKFRLLSTHHSWTVTKKVSVLYISILLLPGSLLELPRIHSRASAWALPSASKLYLRYVSFSSVFAQMSPFQWEGLWSSYLDPPVQTRPCLAYFSSALTSYNCVIYLIVCLPDQTVSSKRAWSFVSFFTPLSQHLALVRGSKTFAEWITQRRPQFLTQEAANWCPVTFFSGSQLFC